MTRITTALSASAVAVFSAAGCERSSEYPQPPADSYDVAQFTLAPERTDTLTGAMVSPEFFTAANVRPLLGRFFSETEYETVGPPVAVISNDLWRQSFSASPQLIGKTVQLNGRPVTIVGVAPPDFAWPSGGAVWVPRVPR